MLLSLSNDKAACIKECIIGISGLSRLICEGLTVQSIQAL